jgi:hypothetical protein
MRPAITIGLAMLFATACGGGGGRIERVCDKADECMLLGPGETVEQCVDEGEMIRASLTAEERRAFDELLDMCLEIEACADFQACVGI